jgi:Glyoxalase-like domain
MSLRLEALTFDAADPAVPAAFWAGMLGRPAVEEADGVLVPGDETQLGLRFVAATSEPSGRGLHLHLTSSSLEDQQATVDRALALGGCHVDVGQLPEEGHIVLGDPEGNLLCVIEPGNSFLAGCGFLAEVACDGSREVGLFWRDALGWTLNWDQDGETSVNPPQGGTKVSWGGPPVEPKHGRNRQRFDLVSDDREADVERLLALGATRLQDDGWLADPEGNELTLS